MVLLSKGIKVGKSTSAPQALKVASGKFFDVYTRHSATSGDSRLGYFRQYFAGADAGGETFRVFSTVEAACTTVHGQHTSLSFGTNGSLSGLGVASRHTLQLKAGTAGGTLAPTMSEISADATTSNASNCVFHRFVLAGDATGAALVDQSAALFDIVGGTVGAAGDGRLVNAISGDKAVTHLAKMRVGGTDYWIMLRNAV